MRTNRICCLVIFLLISILFTLGCGNGAKYPVFGPTIDMIHGTWELDKYLLEGVLREVFDSEHDYFIFDENGTGRLTYHLDSPIYHDFTWSATSDSIFIRYNNSEYIAGVSYSIDWTELRLNTFILETVPGNPRSTLRYKPISFIYRRID